MKKAAGIIIVMMIASVVLVGCYSKTCEQPMPTHTMKGGAG